MSRKAFNLDRAKGLVWLVGRTRKRTGCAYILILKHQFTLHNMFALRLRWVCSPPRLIPVTLEDLLKLPSPHSDIPAIKQGKTSRILE